MIVQLGYQGRDKKCLVGPLQLEGSSEADWVLCLANAELAFGAEVRDVGDHRQ